MSLSATTGAVIPGGLEQALERLNALRRRGERDEARRAMEETLELVFASSCRLAVYGSLAPGESNHGQLRELSGEWIDGSVHGELLDRGWGARLGYPALRWHPAAWQEVAIRLLISEDLPRHWDRLDAFEGDGYQRILVPVYRDRKLIAVANLYELK